MLDKGVVLVADTGAGRFVNGKVAAGGAGAAVDTAATRGAGGRGVRKMRIVREATRGEKKDVPVLAAHRIVRLSVLPPVQSIARQSSAVSTTSRASDDGHRACLGVFRLTMGGIGVVAVGTANWAVGALREHDLSGEPRKRRKTTHLHVLVRTQVAHTPRPLAPLFPPHTPNLVLLERSLQHLRLASRQVLAANRALCGLPLDVDFVLDVLDAGETEDVLCLADDVRGGRGFEADWGERGL